MINEQKVDHGGRGDNFGKGKSRLVKRKWFPWFVGTLVLSIGVRVFTLALTEPVVTRDSSGYTEVAGMIARCDFAVYNGARTPAYPLMLSLLHSHSEAVVVAQMCLGIAACVEVFWIAWLLTGSAPISAFAAAFSGLNLSQIRYETFIQPETLSTIALVTAVLSFVGAVLGRGWRKPTLFVASGISVSIAALARPLFAVVPLALALPLLSMSAARKKSAFFLVPAILPILAWSFFLSARFGSFGLTTLAGFSLTNHSGAFIEHASDEYAAIRDPYLEVRKARGGDHRDVIWSIIGGIESRTGKTYSEISKAAGKMSVELFARYPFQYLKSVARSWIFFMDARGRRSWEGSRNSGVGRFLANVVWRVQWYVMILVNALFLALVPLYFWRRRKGKLSDTEFLVCGIALIVIGAQISQAVVEWGHNGRYGVPFQPLTGIVVLVIAFWLWSAARMEVVRKRGKGAWKVERIPGGVIGS